MNLLKQRNETTQALIMKAIQALNDCTIKTTKKWERSSLNYSISVDVYTAVNYHTFEATLFAWTLPCINKEYLMSASKKEKTQNLQVTRHTTLI